MSLDQVFEALSSAVRRKILAYLSATDLTAGEIAERFNISKPSISKHLSILENAGLIKGERRGQFIHYSLVRDNLMNTVNGYLQEVCPVSDPLRRKARVSRRAKPNRRRPGANGLTRSSAARCARHLTALHQPVR